MNNISSVIQLLRVKQYVKNVFVFSPLLFSFNYTGESILGSLIAFLLFSSIASSIYVFNDLMDIDEDRRHPKKKLRPLASGKVSSNMAVLLIFLLSAVSLTASAFIKLELFYVLFGYFLMNVAYSLKLKHITIIDIFIIATGFVLRVFAGGVMINADLSMWIIIMTFLLALFLAIAKRRDDVLLAASGKETRKNIDGYNLEFVNAIMVLMSGVIIVSYILYSVSTEVTSRLETPYLYITSVFVTLGIIRYMQITFVEENSGSPTSIVLSDKFLQLTILAWISSFTLVVGLK